MISTLISALIYLVISLAVLYCFYLLVNWILGVFKIVAPIAQQILYVICAVIAFILVLNFLGSVFGGLNYPLLK